MTISTEQNRVSNPGDGATVLFSYTWRILEAADLAVVLVDDATGVGTVQVLDTDYTVAGAGDAGGGSITMTIAPAVGETLVLYGDPVIKQDLDLSAGGNLPAESLEDSLDRTVTIAKRTREIADRALHLPDSDPVISTEIANYVDRANMLQGYDDDGSLKLYSPTEPAFDTFTASRVIVSDASGLPTVSSVTSGQLLALSGIVGLAITEALVKATARGFTKQQYFAEAELTDGANIAWDLDDEQVAKVTLGGNRTLDNPTNMVAGATYRLAVYQDGTGSRTLSYGSAYNFGSAGAPTLSTTAGDVDFLYFDCDGTTMYASHRGPFTP